MSRVRGVQRLHGRFLRQLRGVLGVVGQYVVFGYVVFGYVVFGYVVFGYVVFGYVVFECVVFGCVVFGYVGFGYACGAAGHACAPTHGFGAAGIEHTCRTPGRTGCHPARAAGRHSGALVAPGRGAGVRRARPRFVAAHPADGSRPRRGAGGGHGAGRGLTRRRRRG